MSGRRGSALVAGALIAVSLSACETTAEKSARLGRLYHSRLQAQKGLSVTTVNADVRVLSTAVISDQNGSAATVTMRSTADKPLVGVPVAITVRDAHGAAIFQNNAPGLEPSLTAVSVIKPHATFTWVNDQLQPAGTPASVSARVGAAPAAPASPPRVSVTGVHLFNDPTSGLSARGMVVNRSTVPQQKLVVFGVARRGSRVVAAGRAILPTVAPGKPVPFTIYFIGNPSGATLAVTAPPTTLR